jgi:hypothetical protein
MRQGNRTRDLRTTILVLVLALLSAATTSANTQSNESATAVPRELTKLYNEDQADRRIDPGEFARLSAAEQESLDQRLQTRDASRRVRAAELIKNGAARTADDFYHAAVIMQHGRTAADSLQAHEWAKAAITLDPTHAQALYLFAASWDRYQIGQGKPQWYGTSVDRRPDGLAELHEIDTSKVTDEERERYTGWTLAERRAWVEKLNERNLGDPK